MNYKQFSTTMAAARDIVRAADAWATEKVGYPFSDSDTDGPFPLDPLTVEWARSLLAANPFERRAPKTERLLALWDDTPLAGYTVAEIAGRFGENPGYQMLGKMVELHLLFRNGPHGRMRYFISAAARDASPPELKIPRLALTKPPRPPKQPRPSRGPVLDYLPGEPRPKKPSLPPRAETVHIPAPSVFDPKAKAIVPEHVEIQRIPTPADRYAVEAPADGFLAQWKRLRGEA